MESFHESKEKKFPKRVKPSAQIVEKKRKERTYELFSASGRACIIRLILIFLEFTGYYLYHSDALFVDAIASSYDLLSSIVLLICLWLAQTPPDGKHPFGHGRIEPIAGMQLAIFLTILGAWLFYQETLALINPMALSQTLTPLNPKSFLFSLAAVFLMEFCYRILTKQAQKHDSRALKTEALHYRLDAANSLLATFALILAALIPSYSHFIDHAAAALIAAFMTFVSIKAAKHNIDQLIDRCPDKEFFAKIETAALSVDGVLGTEKVRIQHYGPDAHIDIDVEVNPELRVDQAHRISQHVRAKIQEAWPAVRDVTVHIEPYYPNDH